VRRYRLLPCITPDCQKNFGAGTAVFWGAAACYRLPMLANPAPLLPPAPANLHAQIPKQSPAARQIRRHRESGTKQIKKPVPKSKNPKKFRTRLSANSFLFFATASARCLPLERTS
jgi:hypothetical protein